MRLPGGGPLLAAAAVYALFAAFSLSKPLTLDQAIPTAWNAGAIARHGFGALGDRAEHYEISHTLLHQNLLALLFAAFGETTVTARALGFLCFLGTLVAIRKLSTVVFAGGEAVGDIAVLLYAINPFAIQYSLLVDQETSVLPLGLLLFFYAAYRGRLVFGAREILRLSLVFALAVWCKEFTPYFILPALGLFVGLRDGVARAVGVTAQIGGYGTALFAASWIAYCLATGVPVLSFWEFSVAGKALSGEFHGRHGLLGAAAQLVTYTGRWITPALLGLAALAGLARVRQWVRGERRVEPADLLWLYAGGFWAITNLRMYQFPRYQYPLYSVVVILVARFLHDRLGRMEPRKVGSAVGVGVALAVVLAVSPGDPLLMPLGRYLGWWIVVPVGLTLVLLWALGARCVSAAGAILALVALCVGMSLSLDVKQCADYTTAVSWDEYGERGFDDTLAFLRARLGDTVPVVRKDLAYYLAVDRPERDREWIYTSIFWRLGEPRADRRVAEALARDDVRYIVLHRYSPPEEAQPVLASCCELVETFGDFWVYRKRAG
jgi:hypothetical protein